MNRVRSEILVTIGLITELTIGFHSWDSSLKLDNKLDKLDNIFCLVEESTGSGKSTDQKM